MQMSVDQLEAMYRRYGLAIERRCARFLGSGADARDAAHETFARAAAKLASYRGEGEQLAWLYRISTNVCLNVLRERKSRGHDWREDVRASAPGAIDGARRAHDRHIAGRILDEIDDDLTRELVVSVYIDEMSQGEAAERAGVSRQTANIRLQRFLERVRTTEEGRVA
jgi:RNA polymerase sigma-70 factor (ECF subfamily)